MKRLSYVQLQKKYGGKFIARSNSRIVAYGTTYKALVTAVVKKRLQRNKLTFAYIHPKGAVCVY